MVPERGKKQLSQETNIKDKSDASISQLNTLHERRTAQLNTRIANPGNIAVASDKEALELEMDINQCLQEGIERPWITLDSIAAVFLSSQKFDA